MDYYNIHNMLLHSGRIQYKGNEVVNIKKESESFDNISLSSSATYDI